MERYELINFFDVLGNAKDGWEINNQCVEFDDLYISEDATKKEILEYLVDRGFLNTSDMRRIYIDCYGDGITVFERKGLKPLCELRRYY